MQGVGCDMQQDPKAGIQSGTILLCGMLCNHTVILIIYSDVWHRKKIFWTDQSVFLKVCFYLLPVLISYIRLL